MGFLSNFLNHQSRNADEDVNQVRARAKRRLIGAAVLLLIGVVGFPLLFETQPRPVPTDVPAVVARKDAPDAAATKIADKSQTAATSAGPASATSASSMIVERADEAGREVASSTTKAAAAATAVGAVATAKVAAAKPDDRKATDKKPEPSVEAKKAVAGPVLKSEPKKSDIKPKKEDKPNAGESGRFVVQVGAFANADGVKQARSKLEKAGLKSYTQIVKTSEGTRTRVRAGPYPTRGEADRAAAKAKAAGLAPSVMNLD